MKPSYFFLTLMGLCLVNAQVAKAQSAPPPSITVTGEALQKVTPDQVTLPVILHAEHKELSAAKEAGDKKLKAVLDIAKKLMIAENKLQTQYTNVSPQYDYSDGKQVFRSYAASSTISITLDDTSKLALLVQDLTNAGIDRIGAAQFGLKDEKKVRDELLSKAVQDARSKAYAIAGALDAKIGKALMISEAGAVMLPPPAPMLRSRMEMASANASLVAAPPPDLPGGLIEVRQSVTASFALEQ